MVKAIYALIIGTLFLTACVHDDGHQHTGTADIPLSNAANNIESEAQTIFTDNLELFIEFDPFVIGETTTLIAHLTQLNKNYSPLENANVSLSLMVEGKHQQQFKSQPGIPGIYFFDVTPGISGDGKMTFKVGKESFNDTIVIDHLHVFDNASEIHSHSRSSVTAEVLFTKEQAWTAEFNVQEVQIQNFAPVIKASGEILAMPGEKQSLVARNNGIILFSTSSLVQGSPVKKGDLLFTISGKGFTENNISVKYHEARLQFEKSKLQYQRHQKLVEEKIVSESQFTDTRNSYYSDSIAYFNLDQTVSGSGVSVYAPLTGYIHELNVSEGQYASTGMVLATISSNKIMLLRADVSQQHYEILEDINDASFRPAYTDRVYTIDELNGKLLAKASSVAENNHYMPVYFEVLNDGSLLEGAYTEFYLKTTARPKTLTVPVSALVEEQNNFFVYVQLSGESYLRKQVQLGHADGIYAEILSGLSAEDRIVTQGVMLLKAASISTEAVHSHSH